MPFVADPESRPSKLVDYVIAEMPNTHDSITYDDLAALLGLPDPDSYETRSVMSSVVTDVNGRLGRHGSWQYLINVPKLGYRIASPADLHDESSSRDQRSMRQAKKSMRATERVITHPDATAADKKAAADAAAARGGALVAKLRAEQSSVRGLWKRPEESPVP